MRNDRIRSGKWDGSMWVLVMVVKEVGRIAFPDIYLYLILNDLIFCKVLCILKVVVKNSERLNLEKQTHGLRNNQNSLCGRFNMNSQIFKKFGT